MKLPNGERAIVDIRKLREYCLNASIREAVTRHACLPPLESGKPTPRNSGKSCLPQPATAKLDSVVRTLTDSGMSSISSWSVTIEL
jgi:hypothetical protein